MGFPKSYFIDLSEQDLIVYECAYCKNVVENSVQTFNQRCNHEFCMDCAKQMIENNVHQCPFTNVKSDKKCKVTFSKRRTDRFKLSDYESVSIEIGHYQFRLEKKTDARLDLHNMKCEYDIYGCNRKDLKPSLFRAHVKNCEYKLEDIEQLKKKYIMMKKKFEMLEGTVISSGTSSTTSDQQSLGSPVVGHQNITLPNNTNVGCHNNDDDDEPSVKKSKQNELMPMTGAPMWEMQQQNDSQIYRLPHFYSQFNYPQFYKNFPRYYENL